MTDEQKKKVFGYMGRCDKPLDGNDMVAAMNKMAELKEWNLFEQFCKNRQYELALQDWQFIPWLMQPERFFNLMAEWLGGKDE